MKIVLCLHKYGVPLDDPCCFPLGYMYISAVLREAGHAVKVINYNLHNYSFHDEIKNADVVLFTGFEEFDQKNREFSAIARSMGIKTILGGALATFDTINQAQYFDVVIVGEGETTIKPALTSSGIIKAEKVYATLQPYPDYEGFGIAEYHQRNGIRHVGVLTSRGCPYKCTFCAQTCRFQMRPIRQVETEIDYYQNKYKPELLVFNDNTLNLDTERFLQICRMMQLKKLAWSAAIRVDQFNSECAIAAKQSGCRSFVVGVESFNQEKLDRMGKRIKVEQIYRTLDLLEAHRIKYTGNILTGLEGETLQQIMDEVGNIPSRYNLQPVLVQPFIGTRHRSRNITPAQTTSLNKTFRSLAEKKGMHVYKELSC